MEKLLHILRDVNRIALRAVADVAPEGYASSGSYDCSTNPAYMGPMGQIITVASWLSIKEVGIFWEYSSRCFCVKKVFYFEIYL